MFPWQDILAGLYGGSVWHIYLAGFYAVEQEKKKKNKGMYIVNL
jgi:hypothetical protein